jgi:Tn3 transposase DDE domain-containing protein
VPDRRPGAHDRGRRRTIYSTTACGLAIVLWNTVYLERAVQAITNRGQSVDDTLREYLSPLGWEPFI